MHILSQLNSKVNKYDEDFSNFIYLDTKDDEQLIVNQSFTEFKEFRAKKPKPYPQEFQSFFDRVPEVLVSSVVWAVKNRFNNDYQKFVDSNKLFKEKFFFIEKNFCDNPGNERRKVKKTLLWACQLLKLVGKGNAFNCPKVLFDEYVNYIEMQTDYCNSAKLINIKGELVKMTTPAYRKQKIVAKNYRIIKTMEQLASDDNFTFSFITLTLPPSFHPNPTEGKNSFSGCNPQIALNEINGYWKRIRALWSKNGLVAKDDFYGCEVNETQKDSTLHKHIMVFHHVDDISIIHNAVKSVQKIEMIKHGLKKLNFDVKLNDGRAKASSYLFKYINKTIVNGQYEPSKDEACLSYYGARAFNFFGMDRALGKFDFLCEHYKNYINYLPEEVITMLQTRDLYLFLKSYSKKFSKINQEKVNFLGKQEKVFLGYAFHDEEKKKILVMKNQFILIENLCMEEKQKDELDYIKDYSRFMIRKNNIFLECLNHWTLAENKKGFVVVDCAENKVNKDISETRLKRLITKNYILFFNRVTVNHHYSRVGDKPPTLNDKNLLNLLKIPIEIH